MMEWQDISTAPAATGLGDKRIIVVGGYIAEPEIALPDGDWWRMRKAEGGITPTHWMSLPPLPAKDTDDGE